MAERSAVIRRECKVCGVGLTCTAAGLREHVDTHYPNTPRSQRPNTVHPKKADKKVTR